MTAISIIKSQSQLLTNSNLQQDMDFVGSKLKSFPIS